ncbi:hypothetical protein LPJ61_004808 [Coemansia biformis]|uniref:Uncharacterized protein n=1 Tax=Coemansia biformis TaxID=1286918 RepID=A0A9W7Y9I8_9FUNG|nr:hypothetical protein LPJ61_004808 [Coemansia biformis]
MIPDIARHVARVTGAMPNELHNDGVRMRISIQCCTVAEMMELQRHPFIWEGVAYEWYPMVKEEEEEEELTSDAIRTTEDN